MNSLNRRSAPILVLLIFLSAAAAPPQALQDPSSGPDRWLGAMHAISSHVLLDHVKELCSDKYQGRLTGTPGYDAAARWAASLFDSWKIPAAGDNGTYLQRFPNPYTLVLPGASLALRIPANGRDSILKPYLFEQDFFPGSTSDAGTVTAEVIYCGYGITAPDLDYDDYRSVDVKGKIVLVEPEVPVSPDAEQLLFMKWRPYSFHDYKVRNAKEHGAAGMLYDYHIANPNCVFLPGFNLTYVGRSVVADLFAGLDRKHDAVLDKIRKERVPQSFPLGKTVVMRNVTEHHPEGVAANVIACLEGSDKALRQEVIIVGAHLDHLGLNPELMPGAHDNASGVAVLMGAAEALSKVRSSLKRSVLFILFGAEEQGVKGSEYYLAHPAVANNRVKGVVNLESVGRGERITAGGARNYPALWETFDSMNKMYVHRVVMPAYTSNRARPRQDAAHFMWAGIPTLSFGTSGAPPLPHATYHTTKDLPESLTPEIMEDLARLVFLAVADMAAKN